LANFIRRDGDEVIYEVDANLLNREQPLLYAAFGIARCDFGARAFWLISHNRLSDAKNRRLNLMRLQRVILAVLHNDLLNVRAVSPLPMNTQCQTYSLAMTQRNNGALAATSQGWLVGWLVGVSVYT
jgi:hypothetical protein